MWVHNKETPKKHADPHAYYTASRTDKKVAYVTFFEWPVGNELCE